MDPPLAIEAPAKINLFLRVGDRRTDGYHPIASWMCTVGLSDRLTFARKLDQGTHLSCQGLHLSPPPENLILRAAGVLRQWMSQRSIAPACGVDITLAKHIPVGGGLGGGSSNAAYTLLALNRLWNQNLDAATLTGLAAGLGSDIPFFLHGPSALSCGRGEILHPVPPPRPRAVVLIFPPFALATAEVYERFDHMPLRTSDYAAHGWEDSRVIAAQVARWADLPALDLLHRLFNDLEPAAFSLCPELGKLRERLQLLLGRPVRMSGSGSTLFTLCDDLAGAVELVHTLQTNHYKAMAAQLAPTPQFP